jgi:hypothetical protein
MPHIARTPERMPLHSDRFSKYGSQWSHRPARERVRAIGHQVRSSRTPLCQMCLFSTDRRQCKSLRQILRSLAGPEWHKLTWRPVKLDIRREVGEPCATHIDDVRNGPLQRTVAKPSPSLCSLRFGGFQRATCTGADFLPALNTRG